LNTQGYHSVLESDEVIFAYKGSVSHALFDDILTLVERKISTFEKPKTFRRKIHVIVVEILQNIFHHLDASQHKAPNFTDSILFILGKNKHGYYIISGNYVLLSDIEVLKAKIEWVNSLDSAELKNRYREILNNGKFSDKGGAGLGFIDIARKSGNPLEYDFENNETDCSFFSLKVKISV